MKANTWTKRMVAASVGMAMLFTGNSMTRLGKAVQPEETQPPLPPETVMPTPPPTEEPGPSEAQLACAAIAENADGRHIFVWDSGLGEMVYCSGEEDETLYPASITKLYSALVALMYLDPAETITAGEELAFMQPGSSRAYISRGCRLTVEMLIEAMLIPSGNDAAYVVAAAAGRKIAGEDTLDASRAVEEFVAEMNRMGSELGLTNSHFMNPDGYHNEAHYMCPKDVALVAALALDQPVVAEYMALQQDSVTFESGEHIAWYNTNHLINPESPYYMENAVGMKTGYTGEAGQCLLGAFREEDRAIIVGIFGAEEQYKRYSTAIKLYEACNPE